MTCVGRDGRRVPTTVGPFVPIATPGAPVIRPAAVSGRGQLNTLVRGSSLPSAVVRRPCHRPGGVRPAAGGKVIAGSRETAAASRRDECSPVRTTPRTRSDQSRAVLVPPGGRGPDTSDTHDYGADEGHLATQRRRATRTERRRRHRGSETSCSRWDKSNDESRAAAGVLDRSGPPAPVFVGRSIRSAAGVVWAPRRLVDEGTVRESSLVSVRSRSGAICSRRVGDARSWIARRSCIVQSTSLQFTFIDKRRCRRRLRNYFGR